MDMATVFLRSTVAATSKARRLGPLLVPCLAVAAPSVAQVPDGHFVTAHFGDPKLGVGGLFTFHPRGPGWTRITGLPVDLTGQGMPVPAGANAVAVMPDGSVIVGQVSAAGATLQLYHLMITNGTATIRRTFALGVGTGNLRAQIAEIEVLGPDTVLVCASTLTAGALGGPGPLANQQLGIVTLSTGAVVACPIVPMPAGVANAVAGDGRWAYVAMCDAATKATKIWKVDTTQDALAALLVSLPLEQINSLELSTGGNLLAMGAQMYTVHPVTGAILGQCPFPGNAFATETVTGMVAGVDGSTASQTIWWAPPCGFKTVLGTPPALGWGIPAGIALAPDPIAYGAPTPVNGPGYRFVLNPNPGGLPLVGSAFSLSVASTTGGANAGAWLLSAGPQQVPLQPFPGIRLHVSPALLLGSIPIPGPLATPAILPLPIPNQPAILGAQLFVQTAHVFGSGLAASEGVRITVL